MNKRVFIIAEAGVNHNGDIGLAKKLIDVACEAKADAVKFQTFKADSVVSLFAPKAEYQKETTGNNENQLEMLRKLELSEEDHRELFSYCKQKRICFLSSPFDVKSVDFLNELGLEIFKIPSGEITNLPYLIKVGSLNKKVIMSTGMSELEEVGDALEVLTSAGTKKENIIVLHCNTAYPAPINEANLLAMLTIKNKYDVQVGYSDHTMGVEVSIAAVALGATVIEKHLTLDRKMDGPDHRASLEPAQLKKLVAAIRNVEVALGDGVKKPAPSESKNKSIVRKSIIALKNIQKGEVFTGENITVKRPGSGINPMKWHEVMGKMAKRDFKKDEAVEL